MKFDEYKKGALAFDDRHSKARGKLRRLCAWYTSQGRQGFIDAFKHETGLKAGGQTNPGQIVGAAIPSSISDLIAKVGSDAYWRAHGQWFIEEMDVIASRVPMRGLQRRTRLAFHSVLNFVEHLMLDSVMLFEDFGAYRLATPGVYGIGKNPEQHIMGFYQGARQLIYGHGSWGLSFTDSHADISASIIRQAIEVRLRRGLGVTVKLDVNTGGPKPVPLSDIIDAIDQHKAAVYLPVPFEHVSRIKNWADMYLHSGRKHYAWVAPRVLAFLRPLLLGGPSPGWSHNSNAGLALSQATFDAIRDTLKTKHEKDGKYQLPLWPTDDCDVIIV